MTVVPVDRLPPGAQGSRQVGSSGTQEGSGDLGKEVGTLERGGKGTLGKAEWSSRDQSPCTAR